MIQNQNSIAIPLTRGGATFATNATQRIVIDRRQNGKVYDQVSVAFVADSDSTDKCNVLALQESDSTAAAGFSNIDGLIGTTNSTAGSSQFIIADGATASTDVGPMHWLHADMRGKARYVGVYFTPAGTAAPQAIAILSRGEGGTDGIGVTNNLSATAQTHVAGVTAVG